MVRRGLRGSWRGVGVRYVRGRWIEREREGGIEVGKTEFG